jgi:ABC-2 type transport system ATP-binding protein
MSFISVCELTKTFQRKKKREGFLGSLSMLVHPDYETKVAVDRVSFEVEQGEVIGYIGPNGAGKSTTIKMLSGILVPTSGSITVAGVTPYRQRIEHSRHIGVVFGQRTQLWWDVPVIDSLNLLRDIYRIPPQRFKENLEKFTDLLGLEEFLRVPVRQLSLGQRVRADITAALMHDPQVLFLDEPTIGVDVVSKERLRLFIRSVNQERKVTVFLTTHDMNEIEKMCPRVIIIDHGRVIFDGSVDEIRARSGSRRTLAVEFEEALVDFELPGAALLRSEGRKKWFSFNNAQTPVAGLIAALGACGAIHDLTVEDEEIEAVIRALYLERGSGAAPQQALAGAAG